MYLDACRRVLAAWNVLGFFIIIEPLVYTYKLLRAMNGLCADYNTRG